MSFKSSPTRNDKNSFKDWLEKHKNIQQYLDFSACDSNCVTQRFLSKRQAVHNRMLNNLIEYVGECKRIKEQCVLELGKVSDQTYPRLGPLCYDSSSDIILVRKILFLERTIREQEVSLINYRLNFALTVIEQCHSITNLLSSAIMPIFMVCQINEQFFLLMKSSSDKLLAKENSIFKIHMAYLKEKCQCLQVSQWFTDFSAFFSEVVSKSVEHIDESLSYSLPIPMEVSLSRAVYHCKPNIGILVDQIVEKFVDFGPTEEYLKSIIDICGKMIPKTDSMTPFEQSVSLMFFFRIVFDRIYEKHWKEMMFNEIDDPSKVWKLGLYPVGMFTLPPVIAIGDEKNVSIREFFRNNHLFYSACQFLDTIIFINNPIDCLYYVHKCLLQIHKAALVHELSGSEATIEHLNRLLCFDDLFSLLFGVLLATDIPDFFKTATFIERFSPKFCLSNSFDYAHSGIIALIMHCRNLSLEKLDVQLKLSG